MNRIAAALLLLVLACSPRENTDAVEADSVEVPIGPGTDSSALLPRDTPMSPRREAPSGSGRPAVVNPDSTD